MSENRVLDQRMSALEQEVEGEKLVSRHILEHTRRNTADIATIKGDIGTLKADMAVLKADVATLKSDVAELKSDVRALTLRFDNWERGLPTMIADTMREVLRERDR